MQLNVDPSAPQYQREFALILERGFDDPKGIGKAFTLFTKAAGMMRAEGLQARRLQREFDAMLRQRGEFRDTLRSYSSERLQGLIDDGMRRGDLAALETIIGSYHDLIDTSVIHRFLMRERLDRGQLQAARHHALHLLNQRQDDQRIEAMSHLMHSEALAGIPSGKRTPLPDDLSTKTCTVGGRQLTLGELQHTLFSDDSRQQPAGSRPGRLLASIALPLELSLEAGGHHDHAMQRCWPRQPAEVALMGDQLIVNSRRWSLGIDAGSGAERWRNEADTLRFDESRGGKANMHPVCDTGRDAIVLRDDDAGGLLAFDRAGRRRWSSSESASGGDWLPYSTPYTAFGTTFVLVRDRHLGDVIQVGIGRLDTDTGTIDAVRPLDQMPVDFGAERMFFDQHFTHDDTALYGFTGTGAVFCIDGETLEPNWIRALPLHDDHHHDYPPAHIAIHGRRLVCWLPSVQTLLCLDSRSGELDWSRQNGALQAIHSRGDRRALIVSYRGDSRGDLLVRLDPASGEPLWRLPMNDLAIGGSGCMVGGSVWLPCDDGLAAVDWQTGRLRELVPLQGAVANKLRRVGRRWCLFSDGRLHLLADDGQAPDTLQAPVGAQVGITPLEDGDRLGDLQRPFLDTRIGLPIRRPFYVETGIRGLHLICDHETPTVALFQESRGWAADYRAPRLIWQAHLPNRRIDGEHILSWTAKEARVLRWRDLNEVYRYRIPEADDGATQHHTMITRAVLKLGRLLIQRDQQVTIIDITTGRRLHSMRIDGFAFSFDDTRFFTEHGGTLRCYDLATGSKRWESKHRHHLRFEDGQLFSWDREHWRLYNAHGRLQDIPRHRHDYNERHALVRGRIYTEPGAILDIADKRDVGQGCDRVTVCPQGALELRDGKAIWHGRDEDITLDGLGDWWHQRLRENSWPVPILRCSGRQLMFAVERTLWMWDLDSGERIYAAEPCFENERIEQMLDNSLLIRDWHPSVVNVVRNRTVDIPVHEQVCSRPTSPDERGWPTTGWLPEQDLNRLAWFPAAATAAQRRYGMQLGSDRHFVYMRFRMNGKEPALRSLLRLNATWMRNGTNLQLSWSLDEQEQPRLGLNAREAVRAWREREDDGSITGYLVIDRSRLSGQHDDYACPRVHLQIEEHGPQGLLGWLRVGGSIHLQQRNQWLDPFRRIEGQSAENAGMRETVYTTGTSFIPQGPELAAWLRQRRLLHGGEANLELLRSMTARCKQSWCVTTILAAMLVERIELLRADPAAPRDNDPAFITRIHAISRELDTWAAGLAISDDWRKRAFSLITLVVHPVGTGDNQLIDGIGIRYNQWHDWWFDVSPSSPLCGAQQEPYCVVLPLGLFAGHGVTEFRELHLRGFRSWTGFSNWAVVQPQGIRWLLHPDGRLDGVTASEWIRHERSEAGPGPVIRIQQPNSWWVHECRLPLGPIDVGTRPDDIGVDAASLLLTLRNLPSDSRIAFNVIDSYRSLSRDDPERLSDLDCYRIAMKRVGGQWDVINELCRRSLELLAQDFPGRGHQAFDKLHEMMKEARIPRDLQQLMSMRFADCFLYAGRFVHLGPVPAAALIAEKADGVADAPAIVLPETEGDVLKTAFSFGGQRFSWQANALQQGTTRLRHEWRGVNTPRVSWHLGRFTLDKAKKVFCFASRENGWRGTPTVVSIWVDGERIIDETTFANGQENHVVESLRLKAGEHRILIRHQWQDDWDLRVHLGDSWGMPLEQLQWQNTSP